MNAQLKPVPQFSRESGMHVLNDIKPLLLKHYEEIAHWRDIPLNCNFDAYLRMEAAGGLRIYTIRVLGELLGYGIFTVSASLHYGDSLQAHQDVLYLDPAYRKGRLGFRFIQYCDSQLRAEGVQVCFQHVKAAHNFGPMLERMDYELIDLIYGRRLDRGN
jgi:GNAT superfamily N-acetyltransferase